VSGVLDFEAARLKRYETQTLDIAKAFKTTRLSLGLTQLEIAPLLGCDGQRMVSLIEQGELTPSASMYRLLNAYADGYRPADWPEENPY